MTWNLWWRFGPWEQRRAAILAVLREVRPDVIGLQEVWATDEENLAEWLAAELGLHCAWAASEAPQRWQQRIGDPTVDVGNAVLSRWPVVAREVFALPPPPQSVGDGQFALCALLDTPSGQFPFVTVHLTSPADASTQRCEEVRALSGFVDAQGSGQPFPRLITGDFNATPDSDEVRLFSGVRTAPVAPGRIFIDAWEYADPAAPWATWDSANPYVAATYSPSWRVDYIFVGPPDSGGRGHVRSARRAGDGPIDGVWPSDHAAVVAELADGP